MKNDLSKLSLQELINLRNELFIDFNNQYELLSFYIDAKLNYEIEPELVKIDEKRK